MNVVQHLVKAGASGRAGMISETVLKGKFLSVLKAAISLVFHWYFTGISGISSNKCKLVS